MSSDDFPKPLYTKSCLDFAKEKISKNDSLLEQMLVQVNDSFSTVFLKIKSNSCERVWVADSENGKLVGVISLKDVIEVLLCGGKGRK